MELPVILTYNYTLRRKREVRDYFFYLSAQIIDEYLMRYVVLILVEANSPS